MQPGDTGHKDRHQKKAVLYDMLATVADTAVTTKAMSPDHARSLLRANMQQEKTRFSGPLLEISKKTVNRGNMTI